jgi:hypothetical protein
MKQRVLTLLGVLLTAAQGFAGNAATEGAELGAWTMDLEAAKALASKKELPILLNFSGSDWCGWCTLMEEQVFATPEWTAYASNALLMVLIDFPQDKSMVPNQFVQRNDSLNEQYGIEGFPTFVLLDSDGSTELGRLSASREATPTSFQAEIALLLKKSAAAQAALASKLDPEKKADFEVLTQKMAANKAAILKEEQQITNSQKKLNELHQQQMELEESLRDYRVSLLDEAEQAEYKRLTEAFEEERQMLLDWIELDPKPNQKNQQFYEASQKKLQELLEKIETY